MKEREYVTLHELTGQESCKKKRNFCGEDIEEKKGLHYKKAVMQRRFIDSLLGVNDIAACQKLILKILSRITENEILEALCDVEPGNVPMSGKASTAKRKLETAGLKWEDALELAGRKKEEVLSDSRVRKIMELQDAHTAEGLQEAVQKNQEKDALDAMVLYGMEEAFKTLAYPMDIQRTLHARDAANQVSRYLKSEQRKLAKCRAMDIPLTGRMTVCVTPDYRYETGDTIEVLKLKSSKPTVSQKAAESDLGLYALFRYGCMLVPVGEKRLVKASYYFLRKNNDAAENMDDDFFNTKGGNIVTLAGMYENKAGIEEEEEEGGKF